MCGIVGIVGKSNVNQALYDALTFWVVLRLHNPLICKAPTITAYR